MVKIPLNIIIHQKILVVTGALLAVSLVFLKCAGDSPATDPRGGEFAGSASCSSCHKEISDSYAHTNHYKTSEAFSYSNFKKLVKATHKEVAYANAQTVSIEEIDGSVFQTLYAGGKKLQSERLDLTFGSGEKAQTFIYWKDNEMYQLPLTYLAEKEMWTNSPGFPADQPYYTRIIPGRCMECHASYAYAAKVQTGPLELREKFSPGTIVFGIDCERCHGPAKQHVEFHQSHPEEKQATHIVPVKLLTRQQQLDMCATCHSGDPLSLQSVFKFRPGDTLSKYYMYFTGSTGEPDVHGKQMQLLAMSKCFQQSTLTCMTCHDTHRQSNRAMLVQQCISCHKEQQHPPGITMGQQDCITCHMPMRASKSLDFKSLRGDNVEYMLRTHRIAVYPEAEWK